MAAVILFIFFSVRYLQSLNGSLTIKGLKIFDQEEKQAQDLIEEFANDNVLTAGLLGGVANLGAAIMPTAQAGIDFTVDDAQENYNLDILEGSGLISQNSPSGGDLFAGLRRETTTYIVQTGDTPFDIAVEFGINTDTILWANNLSENDIIKPGQKLLILPLNGVQIKITKGNTLASLAKKYQGKVEEIMSFNHLSEDVNLVAGNLIIIPDGEMPFIAPTKSKISAPKYAQATVPIGGWLIVPTTGHNWGRLHNHYAVDISNTCGTPIYAAASGKIILADSVGWNSGYGKYIIIRHSNGVATLYGHTSQILIGLGEEVQQGQLIALMGATGRSSGCHLHFEVRGAANPLVIK